MQEKPSALPLPAPKPKRDLPIPPVKFEDEIPENDQLMSDADKKDTAENKKVMDTAAYHSGLYVDRFIWAQFTSCPGGDEPKELEKNEEDKKEK